MSDYKKYLKLTIGEIRVNTLSLFIVLFACGLINNSPGISACLLLISFIAMGSVMNKIFAFDILSDKAYMLELFPISGRTKLFSKLTVGCIFQALIYCSFFLGNGLIKLITGERGDLGTAFIENVYRNGITSGIIVVFSIILATSAVSLLFYKLSIMHQFFAGLGLLATVIPAYIIIYYIMMHINKGKITTCIAHPMLLGSVFLSIAAVSIICEIKLSESEDNNIL